MAATPIPIRDVHLPGAVGLWPLAPGWWVLIALLTVALLVGGRMLWRSYRQGVYRRVALRQLSILDRAYREHGDAVALAASVSELLRRTMLAYAPRSDIAGLTGQAWLDWLDRDLGIPQFTGAAGRCLLELPYRKPESEVPDNDIQALLEAARNRLSTPLGEPV
ncbi:MAG: DUF4381 domain-containing protein [Woeseiaceae bacterium]|nr:DUF4381 domain-containing protein [Woeseiaceae bacterium]